MVPELHNLAELVPGGIFLNEKSILVLVILIFGRNVPWVASLVKLHVWSLEFASLAELVPGNFKMENWNDCPWIIGFGFI